jgi:poly(A) polymerase
MNHLYQRLPISDDTGFIELCNLFAEHNAKIYAIGGSVRDTLLFDTLDMSQIDIDLATPLPPLQVIEILEKNAIKYLNIGLEFGTITARLNKKNYEITSFRQDITTNGRHAVVAYTNDMILDAQRRDFTINALYYAPEGIIYDPLESGLHDLQCRKIQFIGTPHNRISEDYLRILRYYRFLARFGFEAYDKTLFTQYDYRTHLNILSPHRIISELKKLIQYPFASDALSALCDLEYHAVLFKDLHLNISTFKQFQSINPVSDYLLASLLYQSDKKNLQNSPLLSRKDRKNILDFAMVYQIMHAFYLDKNWGRILELQYDFNISLWRDMVSLVANNDHDDVIFINTIKDITLPECPVTGKDLLTQGYVGKEISEILKQKRYEFVLEFFTQFLKQDR